MSDIRQLLAELGEARITPAVLEALDFVVPGEWTNHTSLDAIIGDSLGVTDPGQKAAIAERAVQLYASEKHYARAVSVFQGVDKVDKIAAAAVLANQVGNTFDFLGILDKFTPKPDTTQALDAALKLTAEIVAFALLRGIPVTSLTEAKAFPATLATYAKADLMRLAAWMTLDGLLPLGPEFISKIVEIVRGVDTSVLTENALYKQVKDLLPGNDAEEQKGFILSSLDSASSYVTEFVSSRGISRDDLASKMGSLVNVADTSMDLLAATVDATTNYYAHTGVQSVARVLVHDAQQALADGEAPPLPVAEASTEAAARAEGAEEGSTAGRWFKNAAILAAGGAGVAVGAMLLKKRSDAADEEEGASALADEDEDEDQDDDDDDDASLDDLLDMDENALEAREAALEMKARRLARREGRLEGRQDVMKERRRVRRARRRRQGGGGRARPGGRRGPGGRGRGRGR